MRASNPHGAPSRERHDGKMQKGMVWENNFHVRVIAAYPWNIRKLQTLSTSYDHKTHKTISDVSLAKNAQSMQYDVVSRLESNNERSVAENEIMGSDRNCRQR